jgi:hypothetical protein
VLIKLLQPCCACCAAAAGLSLNNLAKILKCAGNDDVVTMKAADDGDTVTLMFESPSKRGPLGLQQQAA